MPTKSLECARDLAEYSSVPGPPVRWGVGEYIRPVRVFDGCTMPSTLNPFDLTDAERIRDLERQLATSEILRSAVVTAAAAAKQEHDAMAMLLASYQAVVDAAREFLDDPARTGLEVLARAVADCPVIQ